jgi:hypothetical protein
MAQTHKSVFTPTIRRLGDSFCSEGDFGKSRDHFG